MRNYDATHVYYFGNEKRCYNYKGLVELIEQWHTQHHIRYTPVPTYVHGDVNLFHWMFMFARDRERFIEFYNATRIEFFSDESVSVFDDIRCELQPRMLAYFLDALHDLHAPPGEKRLRAPNAHQYMLESDFSKCNTDVDGINAALNESAQQYRAERRRSKRRRMARFVKDVETPRSSARDEQDADVDAAASCDDEYVVPTKPVRRSECNVVQWKRHQVQARKELHSAVLGFNFAAVRYIVERWRNQSEQEQLLDFAAVEWALRRICKQLLPMAAAKAQAARQNGLAMIDMLFECFSSLHLCKSLVQYTDGEVSCMREHLRNIVATLPHRADIAQHVLQIKCECTAV
jgi:hypothetical protein